MGLNRIKHIAVAVKDIDYHIKLFSDKFGVPHSEIITVENQGVRVAFLEFENIKIELISPLDESANLNKFLEKKGEGLHHICIAADDVARTLEDLVSKGVQLIDREPRPGAEGKPVAFLHPKTTGSVLIELEEA